MYFFDNISKQQHRSNDCVTLEFYQQSGLSSIFKIHLDMSEFYVPNQSQIKIALRTSKLFSHLCDIAKCAFLLIMKACRNNV